MKVPVLVLGLALGADAGASATLFSGATSEPHGLLQLELRGARGHFRRVISVHLPPVEIESLDVTIREDARRLCLEPAPAAIEPCLERKGDTLVATLKGSKQSIALQRRP